MQSVVHLLSSCKFCCGSAEPVKMALRASRAVWAQFSTSSLWSISMTLPSSRSSQAGSMRLETTALTVSTAQTNRQTDFSWGRIQESPLVSQRFLNWLGKKTHPAVSLIFHLQLCTSQKKTSREAGRTWQNLHMGLCTWGVMEAQLQQTNSLSNSERFDVNFFSQNLKHKNKEKKKSAFSQETPINVLIKFPSCASVLLAHWSGVTW